MSRFVPFAILDIVAMPIKRIKADSVVDLAYDRIRAMIEDGELPPGARLGQGELADAFGISRTTVREALHRLTGELLVEFETNRGFFVTPFRLDVVVQRLEARRTLEPEIVRLAGERMSAEEIDALVELVEEQVRATSPRAAHELSREFHLRLAHGSGNPEFVRILESLWTGDVGRQLVERRRDGEDWQAGDAGDHRAIAAALQAGDPERAAELMAAHIGEAHDHWAKASEEVVMAVAAGTAA
jgi:DNA-binding GntR family transcriptional regulator